MKNKSLAINMRIKISCDGKYIYNGFIIDVEVGNDNLMLMIYCDKYILQYKTCSVSGSKYLANIY